MLLIPYRMHISNIVEMATPHQWNIEEQDEDEEYKWLDGREEWAGRVKGEERISGGRAWKG